MTGPKITDTNLAPELARTTRALESTRAELVRVKNARDGLIEDMLSLRASMRELNDKFARALLRARRAEQQLEDLADEADRKIVS